MSVNRMTYIHSEHIEQKQETVVTLGNFDGLHRGHRTLIDKVKQHRQYQSVVFSFEPHPLEVLQGIELKTIFSSQERQFLLAEMGIDIFIEYPFTKAFSAVNPQDFMERILYDQLKCRALVVGEDYRFGKDKAGDSTMLKEIGGKFGISVEIVAHDKAGGAKISSTDIRAMIAAGEIEKANAFLGRDYFLMGIVSTGKKVGRTIGFPTINVLPPSKKLLPPNGVYVTQVQVGADTFLRRGVTNVGNNPTVGGVHKTVETFLFDFDGEAYGKPVKINFLKWLRPEKKFGSIEELKTQIANDTDATKSFFQK